MNYRVNLAKLSKKDIYFIPILNDTTNDAETVITQ